MEQRFFVDINDYFNSFEGFKPLWTMYYRVFGLLLPVLLLPGTVLANMNGGLHIDPAVIAGILALLVLFIVSILLSVWNISRKSRGLRIFNTIVWVPMTVVTCLIARAGILWPLLVPVLEGVCILGSRSKPVNPDLYE